MTSRILTDRIVRLQAPDAKAFAPFGRFVTAPQAPDTRTFHSDAFTGHPADSAAVVHVNRVSRQTLPLTVGQIERHPHAAQCFVPLDVTRYTVLVMPSDAQGEPLPDQALAFDMPGTMGVIYRAGVWHMGATVLERDGCFVVIMWRGGARDDDESRDIPPITLADAL